IADARFRSRAIYRQDIISSERSPMYVTVRCPSPFFDPRKQALNPRSIELDPVPITFRGIPFPTARWIPPQRRYEVLGPRENEYVGLLLITVLGDSFGGLT